MPKVKEKKQSRSKSKYSLQALGLGRWPRYLGFYRRLSKSFRRKLFKKRRKRRLEYPDKIIKKKIAREIKKIVKKQKTKKNTGR